jgi:IPT/TIG domain-containing protein
MRACLVNPCKPFPSVRVAFVAVLTLLLSGWTTCTAIVNFSSCPGTVPQPQITSLSPDTIPGDAESVLLIVNGSGFVPQSQIMWNGSALQTTFTDSRHLQATITQQTFDSFGGSAGSAVQISVWSQGSVPVLGCPNGGNSATLVLVIN